MKKEILFISIILFIATTTGLENTCSSCSDCTAKLNGSYDVVKLTTDIIDQYSAYGACITFEANNVEFDCQGYRVDGVDLSWIYGIWMSGKSNNTIRNCVVTDFHYGIYISRGSNNVLVDNEARSHNIYGIYISYSDNNTLNSNKACYNRVSDFNISNSEGNSGDENTCDNPGEWNDIGTSRCTSSCGGENLCSSCEECSAKLNGSYEVVKLTQDIINHTGGYYSEPCITFGTNSVELDCQGHRIDGDDSDWDEGISILEYFSDDRSENTITNCTITGFGDGIYIYGADDTTITGNTIGNTTYGIHLKSNANYNTITDNEFIDNCDGIYLDVSGYNTITDNTFINCDFQIGVSKYNVVEDNTVNGKPLVYLEGVSGQTVDEAGQVLLVDCEDITVEGLTISNVSMAIVLRGTNNSLIVNNNVSSLKSTGIYLYKSNYNTITKNTANSNLCGISLVYSNNSIIANNTADSNSNDGISISGSSYNILINNTVSENEYGINLQESHNNTLRNNTLDSNNDSGVYLWFSSGNTLLENIFTNDGLYLYESYQSTVEDNTLNGMPLVHLEGVSNQVVEEASQVILVRSDNITVTGLTISNISAGVQLWETNNSLILNNTVTGNNHDGIYLHKSSNNTLSGNTVNLNNDYGIYLDSSDYNTLRENNVSENTKGIYLWNTKGICLYYSNHNNLTSNTANSNGGKGIYVYGSDYNIITKNTALENEYGVYLDGVHPNWYSANNTISYNRLCDNNGWDIVGIVDYLETNSGEGNTCDSSYNWNDTGILGNCTYSCSAVTTTTTTSTTTSTISTSEVTCSSCDDCSSKLNGDYEVVRLTTDLLDQSETCIQFSSGYVEFDCQGYTISGDETAGAGINMADSYAIWSATVRNCIVTDFWYGIRLLNAYSCTLVNNSIISNNDTGIRTENSFYNTIENNTITSNQFGLLVTDANHPNYITNNVVSSNTWIGIYMYNADYTRVNSNEACYNAESDFWIMNSDNVTGTNNTCDAPDGWNDTETVGCTYSCSAVTTTSTTTIEGECALVGDYPPCGVVELSEVIDLISTWAAEQAELSDVIDLINAWASG